MDDLERIPVTFIRHAADTLGNTTSGLSGTKIIKATAAYAVEFNCQIPHEQMSMNVGNKRTALFDNLMAFTPAQQYKIIRELCDHPSLSLKKDPKRTNLKMMLASRYRRFDPDPEETLVNLPLIEETRYWLGNYPEALSLYSAALEKHHQGAYFRNLLDDLRLSLESLLRALFANSKSLENQKNLVGGLIKGGGGSPQLCNMFMTLLGYYTQYQNDHVKHNDAVNEHEIEFVLEITSSFMKHLVRVAEGASQSTRP